MSNLAGTTWVFNQAPTAPSELMYVTVLFTSNNQEGTHIYINNSSGCKIDYDDVRGGVLQNFTAYTASSGWSNGEEYRTFTFSSEPNDFDFYPSKTAFMTWLENNAVKQIPPLIGTTWTFKDNITYSNYNSSTVICGRTDDTLLFTSSNNLNSQFTKITGNSTGSAIVIFYGNANDPESLPIFNNGTIRFDRTAYQTITFVSEPDVFETNKADFVSWLEENATKENNYIVRTSELTKIADAIRNKAGTSSSIAFPDGFVSRINELHQLRTKNDDLALSIGNSATYLPTGTYYKLKTYSNLYSQLLSNANVSSGTIQINKISLPNTGNDIICAMRIYGTNNITFYAQNTGSGGAQLSANQAVLIEYTVAYYV